MATGGFGLDDLAREPERAERLSQLQVCALIARCVALEGLLVTQLMTQLATTPPEISQSDELLAVPEVAKRLGLRPAYTYELVRRGDLPGIRVGKYVRVRASSVERYLNTRNA